MNDLQLSPEYKELIKQSNHLDFIDLFHDDYYAEMQAINFELAFLKAKSERPLLLPSITPQSLSLSICTLHGEMTNLMNSLNQIYAENAQSAIDLENRQQIMASRTDDAREAMLAFMEKRLPNYQNK